MQLNVINEREPHIGLYRTDCRNVMRHYIAQDSKFSLIFADPPFNQGEAYSEWNDKQSKQQFWSFTYEWLQLAATLLTRNGSLWLNVPDSMAPYVIAYLSDDIRGENVLTLRDWCIWHFKFGQCTSAKFINSHVHALHFIRRGREDSYTWNPLEILVNSDRATKYNDDRTYARADKSDVPIGKRLPFTIWSIENDGPNWGRIQGNNAERVPTQANQLPEKYLERVIRSSSNVDSWLLDLFAGSGTMGAVAKALKRNCIMCEIGEREANAAIKRIEKGAIRVKL